MVKKTKRKKTLRIGTGAKPKSKLIDVLILHGKDQELVSDLIELFTKIGLPANNVLGLPSNSLPQYDRVNYAIKNSGVNIVLASFNEDEPNSLQLRGNVSDELRYSIDKRAKATIVLREKKEDGTKVELPSNIIAKCIIIEFQRTKFLKICGTLIDETKRRLQSSSLDNKMKAADFIHSFLDEMDRIWEDEFDDAGNQIVKNDWETENNFQFKLDEFFQRYWDVFDSLVRGNVDNDKLKIVCDDSIKASHELAAQVWFHVSEGNMKAVEERLSRKEKDKKFNADEVVQKKDQAYQIMRSNRKGNNSKEKIQGFRKAVALLKECLK